ncbi:MAG: 50S ribosomal protein L24 [Eubacteriales bacterium]
MNTIHIKKGDTVKVLSGKSKGKQGKVIATAPAEQKAMVEGVNMVSKHHKARTNTDTSGIVKTEGALYVSKLQLVCPKCGKATRVGTKVTADGKKVRVCKKCSAEF